MCIREIFDRIEMATSLFDAYPRQTVSIRTDASVLGVGFKMAGKNICIDIIEKSMIARPQLWVMLSLRSQAKSNLQLCHVGCVIKVVTGGCTLKTSENTEHCDLVQETDLSYWLQKNGQNSNSYAYSVKKRKKNNIKNKNKKLGCSSLLIINEGWAGLFKRVVSCSICFCLIFDNL